jgi:hypothetical protein
VLSYFPAGHATEQAWHRVPSKNLSTPHWAHWESVELVQVSVDVQSEMGLHVAQASNVPLIK